MNHDASQSCRRHAEHTGDLATDHRIVVLDRDRNLGDSEHGTRSLARIAAAAIAAVFSIGGLRAEEPPSEKAAQRIEIEQTGDTTFRYGEITFDKKDRSIRVPTEVCIREELLEYALVHENGKIHESLLSTSASAMRLHTVFLLLGFTTSQKILNPALPPDLAVSGETAEQIAGAQINATVSWEDPESGKPRSAPLDSWISHVARDGTRSPASPGPFTLTGSRIYEGKFVAETDGNIFAIYLDPTALINNPRPDSFSDEVWFPNTAAIPPVGTPVTLIFSPSK